MEQFIKEIQSLGDLTNTFTLGDVFLATVLSFISGLIISGIYKATYKGIAYSQAFVQAIIIMEITVSVLMLVIGSNIARAFSLVGTLAIVRFRTSVKDPKDVAFIFFAMAAGMAFGTKYYLAGIVFTVILSAIIYLLFITDYGRKESDYILKIRMPEDTGLEKIEAILKSRVKKYYTVGRDNIGGGLKEAVYVITQKSGSSVEALIGELQKVNEGNKVVVIEGKPEIDI